jgi:pSer/pThr/pTyr-binding forkhead associated (FHA) protein
MSGFTIVDLNTKHGTRVNAEKIRERPLRNDDVIQIGAARFVFREG